MGDRPRAGGSAAVAGRWTPGRGKFARLRRDEVVCRERGTSAARVWLVRSDRGASPGAAGTAMGLRAPGRRVVLGERRVGRGSI